MSVEEKNRAFIKRIYPELLDSLDAFEDKSEKIETLVSKSGRPVFKYCSVAFHSLYKPEDDAKRYLSSIDDDTELVWLFGLGYGWHIEELIKKNIKIVIIEPSLEIFKSALENVDLTEIISKCELIVGHGYRKTVRKNKNKKSLLLAHRPYLRFFEKELNSLETALKVIPFLSRKKPKIMLISPIYGGSETTYRYVKETIEKTGATVVPFDATFFAPAFFKIKEFAGTDIHASQLNTLFTNMLGEASLAFADKEQPDLIFAMAQAPIDVAVLPRMRELKVPLAFWFVEDFRTLKYWDRVAPLYDYFFTIQRGEFFEKLAMAGAKNVAYIPQATSPAHHKPLALTAEEKKKYGSDISFMGAGYKNRKEFFKGLLDYDFKIWGTEWDLQTNLGELVQNRNERMKPEEYIKIFLASKININLHSSNLLAGIDPVGDFLNPRIFEIAACGAFQITDSRAELPALLEVGKEIETFSSLSELREKIDYYLTHEKERERIAKAGMRKVLAEHTFDNRIEDMLRIIIENEGETFAVKKPAEKIDSRDIVKKMIEEAGGDKELAGFLKNFDQEKPLSLKEVMDKIEDGKGSLSRVETIFQVVNQIVIQS